MTVAELRPSVDAMPFRVFVIARRRHPFRVLGILSEPIVPKNSNQGATDQIADRKEDPIGNVQFTHEVKGGFAIFWVIVSAHVDVSLFGRA
jgi:hypothetical protein